MDDNHPLPWLPVYRVLGTERAFCCSLYGFVVSCLLNKKPPGRMYPAVWNFCGQMCIPDTGMRRSPYAGEIIFSGRTSRS